ncbi:MAG: Rrf2 family transcriptional regulator [Planctomycetes bacterium]|nr:Rrf2 family transcriptional regulator [Planctomycetota bacterium]
MFSSQTLCALAALACLVEAHDREVPRVSATEIADACGQPRPFVAKILSQLAGAGLVTGWRGPRGGFALTRPPDRIQLGEVVHHFEDRVDEDPRCPFGGGICGTGDPCPLHDKLTGLQSALDRLLGSSLADLRPREPG